MNKNKTNRDPLHSQKSTNSVLGVVSELSRESNPVASVIILNYNGAKVIAATIESVLASQTDFAFEIIIVDNNSQDKSQKILRHYQKFPQVKLVLLDHNYGFAGGNNRGIAQSTAEFVVLLNNDCVVEKDWLQELVAYARKHKNAFSVGSKIYLATNNHQNKKSLIQNAGTLVFQDGYGRDIGTVISDIDQKYPSQSYERDDGQYDQEQLIYATCGAAVLYRRSMLEQLGGGLDDSFFLYYEDTALAEQAALAGFDNYYCPAAIVHHYHAYSSGEGSPFFLFHVEKGRLLHVFYNFPPRVFWREYCKFSFISWTRLLWGALHGAKLQAAWAYVRASFDLLFHLPRYWIIRLKRYRPDRVRVKNHYQQILRGDWYFGEL